jgi:regulator of nonsense transcripts 1
MRDDAERDVLDSADVICTTCNGSSDGRLKNMKFLYVLIDEAT